MATGTIHFDSRALQGATTYSVFLPEAGKAGPGPYHVLLQLHGKYDDHRAWVEKSRLGTYVERIPLIVVMPSGGNFWWSNISPQGREDIAYPLEYESYLMEDLWEHVETTYPVRAGEKWAIGGLSMGGFGALRLGLKYPDRFSSVFAHSSAPFEDADMAYLFPLLSDEARADMNGFRWAEKRAKDDLPRITFDCGLEDDLLKYNRLFHAHLQKLGIAHTYTEYPGAHTWDYWDAHVRKALAQHCEVLGIAPHPLDI